jgi:hypothetical protein
MVEHTRLKSFFFNNQSKHLKLSITQKRKKGKGRIINLYYYPTATHLHHTATHLHPTATHLQILSNNMANTPIRFLTLFHTRHHYIRQFRITFIVIHCYLFINCDD